MKDDIYGFHHITLNVGSAQEDYDFHVRMLGLKLLKKTVLYDGELPIYHLYYGNHIGDEGTVITTLPFGQAGLVGKPGSGQVSSIDLGVPRGSLDFWIERLHAFGVALTEHEAFGERSVRFSHPCGIRYQLVETDRAAAQPYSNGAIPPAFEIVDMNGITIDTHDVGNTGDFLAVCWGGTAVGVDGSRHRYRFGAGASARFVDLEPSSAAPGSWTFGQGTVHHCAFSVGSLDTQARVKSRLVGNGFVDVSEVKDRGYFDSIYVRTPSGVLFEAAVSKQDGFMIDEPYDKLGTTLLIPDRFEHRRQDIIDRLESIAM